MVLIKCKCKICGKDFENDVFCQKVSNKAMCEDCERERGRVNTRERYRERMIEKYKHLK